MDDVSDIRLVSDAGQNEKEKLRQLLLDGLNSEAVTMTKADWDAMREEVKRRAGLIGATQTVVAPAHS